MKSTRLVQLREQDSREMSHRTDDGLVVTVIRTRRGFLERLATDCQAGLPWIGSTIASQLGHSAHTPASPSVVSYPIRTHDSRISWAHCGQGPSTGLSIGMEFLWGSRLLFRYNYTRSNSLSDNAAMSHDRYTVVPTLREPQFLGPRVE